MPSLTTFSLKKYNEARQRLKELSSGGRSSSTGRRATAADDEDDDDVLQDKTNLNRQASNDNKKKDLTRRPATAVASNNSNRRRKKETPPAAASASGSSGDAEQDLLSRLAKEVDEAREVLVGAIRTSGLRPARESGLLSAMTKLDRHQKALLEASGDRTDKVRLKARGIELWRGIVYVYGTYPLIRCIDDQLVFN